MSPNLLTAAGIGLLLGVRHAFEPDHLAAVSTLATRPGARLWGAVRVGVIWGLGHTVTVGAVVALIVVLGLRLPSSLWPIAELAVAGLLVLLGASVIWRYLRGRWHMHTHTHAHTAAAPHLHLHSHARETSHGHAHAAVDVRRSLGFGVAHGLAGSGAIAALLVAAVPDTTSRLVYFTAFSAGTIVGMLGVSLTLSVLVRFAAERGARWATILHVGAAVGSVMAGIVLGWGVLSS
jgi:ABC-type nickel/cobalt efflux system permease component RcnA